MPYEKLPKEYNAETLQKVIDQIQSDLRKSEANREAENIDLAQQVVATFNELDQKIEEKTAPEDGLDSGTGQYLLPVPQNLKVFELITWGWTTVNPFYQWKYFGKIRGYEFYGSQNSGFEPHRDPYLEAGVHYGTGTVSSKDTWLYSEDTDNPSNTHIFALGLNTGQILLENSTRSIHGNVDSVEAFKLKDSDIDFSAIDIGTSVQNARLDLFARVAAVGSGELTLDTDIFKTSGDSYIVGIGKIPIVGGYNALDLKHKIKAIGVKWVEGDEWRITNHPPNRLPNIGAFATYLKRPGNFYVKARAFGKGNSFGDFTAETTSTGLSSSEDLSTPVFIDPIYSDGITSCEIETNSGHADYGKPIHPKFGAVEWSSIIGGCRETDHIKFFGFEWCNVELVYNTVPEDDTDVDIYYNVVRTGALFGDPVNDEDEEESDLS